MIHSKSREGFTLIETLLALSVMALLLTPLYLAQGTILRSVAFVSTKMQRVFFMKSFFFDARAAAEKQEAKEFVLEKKVDDPLMRLKYALSPVKKDSSLARFKGMHIERVRAVWEQDGRTYEDGMIALLYKHQKEQS